MKKLAAYFLVIMMMPLLGPQVRAQLYVKDTLCTYASALVFVDGDFIYDGSTSPTIT